MREIHMIRRRTTTAVLACALALGLVAAACTPPTPPPVENWKFQATKVQVINQTEYINVVGCGVGNCYDEPYHINIWFRAKFGGGPTSVQTGVVDTRGCSPEIALREAGKGGPDTKDLLADDNDCYPGTVAFNNVQMLDVLDINDTNKLEVLGVWQWAMEEDQLGFDASGIASALNKVLQDTVAGGTVPNENLVTYIINTLFSGGFVTTITTAFGLLGINIPIFGDDTIGSRLFVGVNARGSLASLIGTSTTAGGINVGFGIPSIQGISITGLGSSPVNFDNQEYTETNCTLGICDTDTYRYWNRWTNS